MTTIEENEVRRLCLRITRSANIASQPHPIKDRRNAAEEMKREMEKLQRILAREDQQ